MVPKAKYPIVWTLLDIVTVVMFGIWRNALSPIDVTVLGIDTVSRPL